MVKYENRYKESQKIFLECMTDNIFLPFVWCFAPFSRMNQSTPSSCTICVLTSRRKFDLFLNYANYNADNKTIGWNLSITYHEKCYDDPGRPKLDGNTIMEEWKSNFADFSRIMAYCDYCLCVLLRPINKMMYKTYFMLTP